VRELVHDLRNPLAALHANLHHLNEVLAELRDAPGAAPALGDATAAARDSLQAAEQLRSRLQAWSDARDLNPREPLPAAGSPLR
jgi:hypothetical protein